MNISVIKRDGTKEPFSIQKIERVVRAAGLPVEKSDTLNSDILNWIKGLGTNEISSLQLRDQVIQELKKLDPYSANLFMWYQKTKEKTQ